MLLVFLLFLRLKQPVGEIPGLQNLSGQELVDFITSHPKTVVLFTEKPEDVNVLSQGITMYKDQISFVLSPPEPSQCNQFPCVVPFMNGKRMRIGDSIISPLFFINWLKSVANPHNVTINSIEQLRFILYNEFPSSFSVDGAEIPTNFPEDAIVYSVNSSLFSLLNLNVTKGFYYYKAPERQLLEYNTYIGYEQTFSSIISIFDIGLTTKPLIGGYIMDGHNSTLCEKHYNILSRLGNKYGPYIDFFGSHGKLSNSIIKLTKLRSPQKPFFFILNSTNLKTNRYFVFDPEQYNDEKYLDAFIARIQKGQEKPYVYSEEIPSKEETAKTVGGTLVEKFNQKGDDILLAITASWCNYSKEFKRTAEVLSRYLKKSNVRVYYIDEDKNDVLVDYPDTQGYPTIYFFKANEKNGMPVMYEGERDYESILTFIRSNAMKPSKVPKYNEKKIKDIERILDEVSSEL
ncbi:Thioredoxin family protein [Histomonas meleagridis]|uniref:Thioredoxin family protein n=1 Tax=Histomonas meleagridis TaxID=135588 RepID=UPI003559B250|nr:Thioredoxin family protein [Histomonas meleagridis]KAH0798501.1 Thioredoxin family protein [Histomonas meleagridis]